MKDLSKQISDMPASPTIAISDKAKALKAAGHDVISLAGGEPDFDTPSHIIDAAIDAMQRGETHYAAPSKGITPLLEAIADKLAHDNDVHVDPATDIVVTPGAKWAINLALGAMVNPGDEVLYLTPAWVSYPTMITLAGGVPVPVELSAEDNYEVTADMLREKVTPKTKVLMMNSPCNPTGHVLSEAEIQAIREVALEADLYIISDEIYEKIIFDGHVHRSIGSIIDMAGRTVTINGFSKAYAMTGWRLGWLAGPTPILKLAARLNTQTVTSAATFSMHAAVAALTGPQDVILEMCDAYRKRRDFMVKALNEIDGVACRNIDGAFYLFPTFPNSDKNSLELAESLLDKAGVAGVPGSAFGASGEGHIRFSIATSMDALEQTVERLSKVASEL